MVVWDEMDLIRKTSLVPEKRVTPITRSPRWRREGEILLLPLLFLLFPVLFLESSSVPTLVPKESRIS